MFIIGMYWLAVSNFFIGMYWLTVSNASLRIGSFFESSNLPLTDLVEFLYFWADNLQSTTFLHKNFVWGEHTITNWKTFYNTCA